MNLLRFREIADYSVAPHHAHYWSEIGAAERAGPFRTATAG
jgi:hypothetical protein